MIWSIQGKKRSMAAATASIFGMKTRVISFICVAAWNTLMTTPAMSPNTKHGAAINIPVFNASVKYPAINSADISPYPKLFINDPTTRYHPSARTNNMSLKGTEIMIGGNIIIPMESNMLATTMSSIRKGT